MKNAYRIAGFGLAAGAAAILALAAPATARGFDGGGKAMAGMDRGAGGVFAVQFTDLDTDGDGFITEAELTARAQALADARLGDVDADGDGTVTAAELEAQIVARIAERGVARMGKTDRQGRQAADPAAMAKVMAERMLSAHDADGDGVLTGAELSPAADIAALIDRFDTDDDNAWSEEEFAQVNIGKGGSGDRGRGSRGDRGGNRR